jgi:S-DNA-T family DNA segregation ATPase FtsK/SpoIIIE
VLGLLAELGVLFTAGTIGTPTRQALTTLAGWTAPLIPLWPLGLGVVGLLRSLRPESQLALGRIWGALAIHLSLVGLCHVLLIGGPGSLQRAQTGQGGGLLGFALGAGLSEAFGPQAAGLLLGAGLVLGLLQVAGSSMRHAVRWGWRALLLGIRSLAQARAGRQSAIRINVPGAQRSGGPIAAVSRLVPSRPARPAQAQAVASNEPPDPPVSVPRGQEQWKLPALSLFESGGGAVVSPLDVRERARTIEETLASFNIEARVVEVNQGPTVTQFGIEPAPGVAVRRIRALQNDLGLRLAAWPVRIEDPVPGKPVVGLEVPNKSVATVGLGELLDSDEAARIKSRLRLALGRDVTGRPVVADLARMPHLLLAGATGSGKSVCINALLASLLSQNTPDDLQLLMIDPKMVELMPFNGIPHLRMPVVTDMEQVVGTLKWVVREMERRYALFVQRGARNIESYNRVVVERGEERPLPFLVVVIDELADMMITAPDEVEVLICRLAQKARATGIHLIVATQRPSVDVLTGLIKANFITRIAFAVSSAVDSRVILDSVGAEKLLGRGDMLFSSGDTSKPMRIQGALVTDQELQKLVAYWRRQGLPRYSEQDIEELQSLNRNEDDEEGDELYERAVGVATQYSRVSTSLLQRRLGVGYPRAARLIDLMEERGVVSTSADGRSREVLNRAEASDEV